MDVVWNNKSTFYKAVVVFFAFVCSFMLHAAPEPDVERDITPPKVIQDNYHSLVVYGFDHEIMVTVTDNIGVKQVVLYYRNIGDSKFKPKIMLNPILKDDYTATVRANEISAIGIEYYIQAKDKAGNTLLHGLKFTPLKVSIIKRNVADRQ